MVRGQNSESDYSGVFAAGLFIKEPQEPHVFCRASQPVNCSATLGARDSDLIARHDRRLWEIAGVEPKSGFCDLTAHALRANRKLENDLVFLGKRWISL